MQNSSILSDRQLTKHDLLYEGQRFQCSTFSAEASDARNLEFDTVMMGRSPNSKGTLSYNGEKRNIVVVWTL